MNVIANATLDRTLFILQERFRNLDESTSELDINLLGILPTA